MLDERKTAILRAVVQEYIDDRAAGRAPPRGQRAGRPRVVGDGPQRDGGARAGGLPASSRTPRPAGCRPTRATASSSTTSPTRAALDAVRRQQVRRLLRQRPRRARADAARHQPPAGRPHRLRRGGRRPRPRGRHRALGAGRRPAPRGSRWSSPCCPTARSRATTSSCDRRRARGRAGRRHGPPGAAPRSGAPWRSPARCPRAATRRSTGCAGRRCDALQPGERRRARVFVGGASRWPRPSTRSTSSATSCDPGAAVRRGLPAARRARPRPVGGDRGRARRRAARRPARSWWRPTSSRASRSAPSACSARPA